LVTKKETLVVVRPGSPDRVHVAKPSFERGERLRTISTIVHLLLHLPP